MASATKTVTTTGGGVLRGAGAGLILAFGYRLFGPLLGTIIGAIIAGMVLKGQKSLIAFLAGFMMLLGVGSGGAAQASSRTAMRPCTRQSEASGTS